MDYQQVVFPYRRSADQDARRPARHAVVIVGAGPIGLSLAIDLALQQVPVVVLDNDDRLSTGGLDFGRRCISGVEIQIGDDDLRAFRCEFPGNRLADSAGGAGDDCNLVFEFHGNHSLFDGSALR